MRPSGLFWSVYCCLLFVLFQYSSYTCKHEVFCLEPQKNDLSLFLPEAICRLCASTALRINSNYTYEMPPEKVQLAQIIPNNIDTPLSTNQEIICLDLFSWTYPTTTLLKKISYFSFSQSYQNFLMISRSRQQHFRPL